MRTRVDGEGVVTLYIAQLESFRLAALEQGIADKVDPKYTLKTP